MALRTLTASIALAALVSTIGCGWVTKPDASEEASSQPRSATATTPAPTPPKQQAATQPPSSGPLSSTPGRPTTTVPVPSEQRPKPATTTPSTAFPSSAAHDERPGFRTKYARFELATFDEVPDWRKDQMRDAWLAFLRGCKTLSTRQLWADTCTRAQLVKRSDEAAIRRFIEQEFSPYQVLDPYGGDDGTITGYYEPLLTGSRTYGERYRYPVYGVPNDLLYLDSRRIPKDQARHKTFARIEGRKVVPVSAAVAPAPGLYPVEVAGVRPDVRDRRLRVRLDRDRIIPYYSRAEIEAGSLPNARVLVWVDDPLLLYTMHVQGVGKVSLNDGHIVRLSYADQNGHPFRSKVKVAKVRTKSSNGIRTRGGPVAAGAMTDENEAASDDDSVDAEFDEAYSPVAAAAGETRGIKVQKDPSAPTLPSVSTQPTQSGVRQTPPGRAGGTDDRWSTSSGTPVSTESIAPLRPSRDPSYVFFREVPDSPEGPVGALGVPLTAGRSVAVDPRITPLGAPLFLSTRDPQHDGLLNRLVVAQDTGGAIRGALRADYFFGFGPNAGQLANRMRNDGRLWLLLPKTYTPTLAMRGGLTRGASASGPVECVEPDPEYCADTLAPNEQPSASAQ